MCELQDLADGVGKFKLGSGKKMQAILASYGDLDGDLDEYQECLGDFKAKWDGHKDAKWQPLAVRTE